MDVFLNSCGPRGVRTLLCVYLLVVKAAVFAGECQRPVGQANIVLTEDALLMNNFPEGSDVILECGNGYEPDSGSGVITCIDGKWSEPDLICKRKDCGPPPPVKNMSYNMSEGTLFGDQVRVYCDKGYQLRGSSFKRCYPGGWMGRAYCDVVTCDIPAGVTNGKHSWDSKDKPKYRETIEFSCDTGFSLSGKGNITCTETGGYDSDPPECKGVTTEDSITTKMVTSAPATPSQGGEIISMTLTPPKVTKNSSSNPTDAATAAATVPPAPPGGRDLVTTEEEATPSTLTPTTSLQDNQGAASETNDSIGVVSAIIGGVCAVIAAGLSLFLIYKFIMKKKGSYDTREDLKPELLQFQNL